MDVKKILQDYHSATEVEKKNIEKQVKKEFRSLSDEEKVEVQKDFLKSLDEKINEADSLNKEANLKMELAHVSQYVSMSYISKTFFGRSRQWLNNRIKGNLVNGKPASFTKEELRRLSSALDQIGGEIKEAAHHITR